MPSLHHRSPRDRHRPAALGLAVLLLLTSSLLTSCGIPHAFTTRLGGHSTGIFDSLNFGNPSDLPAERRDPAARIALNKDAALRAVGMSGREFVEVHQVHGDGVHVVRAGGPSHAGPETTKADAIVNEARDRVRAAVVNSGATWPDQRVTINLAPSTLPKTGSHYDLAIALAMFVEKKIVPLATTVGTVFIGELALDGRLRAVRGVLPATVAAAEAGFERVFVPESNVGEA